MGTVEYLSVKCTKEQAEEIIMSAVVNFNVEEDSDTVYYTGIFSGRKLGTYDKHKQLASIDADFVVSYREECEKARGMFYRREVGHDSYALGKCVNITNGGRAVVNEIVGATGAIRSLTIPAKEVIDNEISESEAQRIIAEQFLKELNKEVNDSTLKNTPFWL